MPHREPSPPVVDEITVRDDREFRRWVRDVLDEIKGQTTRNTIETANIVARLDTLNGSVAKQGGYISELQANERVRAEVAEALEAAKKEKDQALEKQAAGYQRWIDPAMKYGSVVLLALAGEHWHDIVKLIVK